MKRLVLSAFILSLGVSTVMAEEPSLRDAEVDNVTMQSAVVSAGDVKVPEGSRLCGGEY